VHHFVRKDAARQRKSITHIPDHLMETLKSHPWPGNIRELQNLVERAVILTRGSILSCPSIAELKTQPSAAGGRTLADAERAHIMATLRETNWVVGGRSGAAARLGVPRTTLISRMQRLGISREIPRAADSPSVYLPAQDGVRGDDRHAPAPVIRIARAGAA